MEKIHAAVEQSEKQLRSLGDLLQRVPTPLLFQEPPLHPGGRIINLTGALAESLAPTVHPHPLSETEAEAAEFYLGGATHVPPVKG